MAPILSTTTPKPEPAPSHQPIPPSNRVGSAEAQEGETARRLTVVQLLPELNGGGVERGTLEVAEELVRRGHRSIVISGGGRLVAKLTDEGSEHVSWPIGKKSPWSLRWVYRLRKFLREQGVDILHARSRVPAWIGWLAWRGMKPDVRPRFVTTVHGFYSVNRYSAIMTRGERVIGVSRSICDYIRENYPETSPRKIHLIHRGVDPDDFPHDYSPPQQWWKRWNLEFPQLRGKSIITLPGRLTRLKGHHDFLDLMVRLKQTHPQVYGLIVGGEDPRRKEYAREIRNRAESLGLKNVVFTGHRSDVREIFAVSDLVLSLSSKPESFGRTVLEALQLGVPVVGYEHGGVGEILNEIFPRGAVPTGDRTVLHQTVAGLLNEGRLTTEPVRQFRLQQMLRQTLALYEELAGERERCP